MSSLGEYRKNGEEAGDSRAPARCKAGRARWDVVCGWSRLVVLLGSVILCVDLRSVLGIRCTYV